MTHVAVIGCGVVGAAIAYELSQVPGITVTVVDRQPPAQAATGAALGVLMGVISQKAKGKAWALRQTSMQRYETLIPELEAITGFSIPYNRQGILLLCFDENERSRWESLAEIRRHQGWPLDLLTPDQVHPRCPQVNLDGVALAIHSPLDRQLDPTALTNGLVNAAQQNGVTFRFDAPVEALVAPPGEGDRDCEAVQIGSETLTADWVVIAAGLGSTQLSQIAAHPVDIRPVLGQALRLRTEHPLGHPDFQTVITGNDIHIVPLGQNDYWVGATVEFPMDSGDLDADPGRLDEVFQGAIALCPDLANATILHQWSGLRPRPFSRPAPVIEPLSGFTNVWLATGHYRNGVLLAPATALAIRAAIAGH